MWIPVTDVTGPNDVKGPESSPSLIPVASDPDFAQKVSGDLVDDAAEALRILSERDDDNDEENEVTEGIDLADIGAVADESRVTTQKIRTAEIDFGDE